MNQRNVMFEEMTKRNNPIEALPYALLEIIADTIRGRDKETGKMADTIKAIIEYEKQEIQGETKTLEEIHRKLYGGKR